MTEMIGLGERTGNVDNTLKALGDYYEKQARMRESVKSAVIYPAVLLVMMPVSYTHLDVYKRQVPMRGDQGGR